MIDENKIIVEIGKIADSVNANAYLIGGYVRDLISGRNSMDIDIMIIGDGIKFAEIVAQRMNTKLSAVYKKI